MSAAASRKQWIGRLIVIAATLLATNASLGQDRRPSTRPANEDPARIRVGAYWWDGWFEGSPYIRAPLTTEFKDREPLWGWRDDSQTAVDESIRFAAGHGIDFFAFLWYPENAWRFPNGRSSGIMNNGLRFYLASSAHERDKVGFLLMIVHVPAVEAWETTCHEWVRAYLSHPRYIRIAGRPVLYFYELSELDAKLGGRERVRPALDQLRRIARAERELDVFLVLRAQGSEADALAELGFDGATDYATAYASTPGEHPHGDLVRRAADVWAGYAGQGRNYIPSITAGWDGRPRAWMQKDYYAYWYRRSPDEFGGFVRKGVQWIREHPKDVPPSPLLMVYAWNEIDEGGAICPTRRDGAAYLEALKAAVSTASRPHDDPLATP